MANWWDKLDNAVGGYLPGGVSTDWRKRNAQMNGNPQMFDPTANRPSGFAPTNPFQGPTFGMPASMQLMNPAGFTPQQGASPNMGAALYQMVMGSDPTPRMAVPGRGTPDWGTPNLGPVKPHGGLPGVKTQGPQRLGDRLRDGVGRGVGALADFAGGNDGANGLMLGNMVLSAWDARQQRKEYEKDAERQRELEEEERRRYDANNPIRSRLLGEMMGGF